jgi:hypothetical protein
MSGSKTLRSRLQTCSGKNKESFRCWTGFATPSVTFYERLKNITEQVANLLQQKKTACCRTGFATPSVTFRFSLLDGVRCRTGFATPSVTFYERLKNITEQVANLRGDIEIAAGRGLISPPRPFL